MKKKIAIIGSGFSGLSASAYTAKDGHEVHVYEQHSIPGGRARVFSTDNGYKFDMGPSWYWMPDIMENFFNDFGYSSKEFYELINLNPQFEIIFPEDKVQLPSDYNEFKATFENIEKGSSNQLDKFMDAAKYKYEVGMQDFIQKPCYSWKEFASFKILKSSFQLNLLTNFRDYVSKYFSDTRLKTIMEFPVIFLGASPKNIPALYSLMNYGGYKLGTWYPKGGFYELVKAMYTVAQKQGVHFHFNQKVEKIICKDKKAHSLIINGKEIIFDAIIASSDYHHTETLLEEKHKNYTENYWTKKVFAPSCLIFYIGINRKIPNLLHHTLFFENELDQHISEIYETKKWPEKPLFYVCCPSKTDDSVAPEGHENLFLLMPLAIGIEDNEELRDKYFNEMLHRIEKHVGINNLRENIDYKRSYCVSDFMKDYNAYKGNAYGLANTLKQTAVLKPTIRNKKINNLFYTGQLTVPGPGVPPSIISGKIVAQEINNLM